MKILEMIWAESVNGVIGKDNKLPWHNKHDLNFFRKTISNKVLIVGRKTYESLPKSIIDGRLSKHIIVLTKSRDKLSIVHPSVNVMIAHDKGQAYSHLLQFPLSTGIVIGGKEIYDLFMPLANRLFVTTIDGYHEGDTTAPFKPSNFKVVDVEWPGDGCMVHVFEDEDFIRFRNRN